MTAFPECPQREWKWQHLASDVERNDPFQKRAFLRCNHMKQPIWTGLTQRAEQFQENRLGTTHLRCGTEEYDFQRHRPVAVEAARE